MIAAALQLELRTLLRSPLRLLVMLLVVATGLFVIARGQSDVDAWRETIASGRAEEVESLDEARGYFEAGESGPEDRPWVDLSAARWQDWYAATRLAREPAPLAGIAFASAEAGAVTVRINRFANPLLAAGTKIENPALSVTGGLDLVTVLTLLIPLMILALGVEVGGQERALGILPLVRMQSGRDRTWISLRCLAIGILTALVALFLCGVATLLAGAEAGPAMTLAFLVIAYVAVWTAVLAAVALFAKHPSQGAVWMGAAWIMMCVVIPALGLERSAALAADDFALDLTVEARDAGSAYDDMEDEEVLTALFARFPALESLAPEDPADGRRLAESGLRIVDLEERVARREQQSGGQSRLVERMSFLSPAVAFTHALEGLAGRGPDAARDYRRSVVEATADRMERYIAATWRDEPLGAGDFEELVAATASNVPSRVRSVTSAGLVLAGWALSICVLAAVLGRRRVVSANTATNRPLGAPAG